MRETRRVFADDGMNSETFGANGFKDSDLKEVVEEGSIFLLGEAAILHQLCHRDDGHTTLAVPLHQELHYRRTMSLLGKDIGGLQG